MPAPINDPFATAALVQQFDLKGRFRTQLDEVVVPVVVVADVRPTSFQGTTYQDRNNIAAVAGEFGAIVVGSIELPSPLTVVLHRLRINAASATTLSIREDNSSAFVLNGAADFVGVNRLSPGLGPGSPIIAASGTLAAGVGGFVERIDLPAGEDVIVDLTGWELPPGVAAVNKFARLIMVVDDANVQLDASLVWSLRNR